MTRPGFLEGTGVALALSLAAGAANATLQGWLTPSLTLRAVITGVGLAYLAYLLSRGQMPIGRPSALALWAAVTAAVWFATPSIGAHLLVQAGLGWLVRTAVFHRRPLGALADLGVWCIGLMSAVWAGIETGSLFISVWCLLLTQAAFSFIPTSSQRPDARPASPNDPFENAHRSAEAALRKLSASS